VYPAGSLSSDVEVEIELYDRTSHSTPPEWGFSIRPSVTFLKPIEMEVFAPKTPALMGFGIHMKKGVQPSDPWDILKSTWSFRRKAATVSVSKFEFSPSVFAIFQLHCAMDGKKNGLETDVDCGGGVCSFCGLKKTCVADSDCDTPSFICQVSDSSTQKVCAWRLASEFNSAQSHVYCPYWVVWLLGALRMLF